MHVIIREDKICLHWDGKVPAGVNPLTIDRHDPKELLQHWPEIRDYSKWRKTWACFVLAFSKQNLIRIHKQFGQIPVLNGSDRIVQLKQAQQNYYDMVQMAKKIKEAPYEKLPVYNYKMKPLGEYQHRGVVYLSNTRKAPLFADCGTGKTFMVLNSVARHKELGVIPRGKTLVTAKLATLEDAWRDDCKKFTDLKIEVLWNKYTGEKKKRLVREQLNDSDADLFVINHDGLIVFEDELIAHGFDKVVVDESTILKGHHSDSEIAKGGSIGKALGRVSRRAEWKVIMSGTPAPNGPHDMWGQFHFLDKEGLIMEPSYWDFMHQHMKLLDLRKKEQKFIYNRTTGEVVLGNDNKPILKALSPRDPQKWVHTKETIESVKALTDPLAFRIRMEDCLKDMPESTRTLRRLEMGTEQKRQYKEMLKNMKVIIDDEHILASIKLTQLMKLRQITGGFIIDHKEEAHGFSDNAKIEELDSILNEEIAADQKVVIYAEYKYEFDLLKERYKHMGIVTVCGQNSSTQNIQNIRDFKEKVGIRIIVLHPRSAAHGITLVNSHYMIFYSFSHSSENDYQARKRIERAGQKFPMLFIYLGIRNSIDTAMYETVQKKLQDQTALIDGEVNMNDEAVAGSIVSSIRQQMEEYNV